MNTNFLLNDFFTIDSLNSADDKSVAATISLNASHSVFVGHFPKMPVVPGVFQTQVIKEVLQQYLKKTLQLAEGDNIKFMGMILPDKQPTIKLEINYRVENSNIFTDAKLYNDSTIFTKFKGTFTEI